MKKFLGFFLIPFLFTLISASPAKAANDLLCYYCPELCGSSSGTPISSGEYFYCRPTADGSNFFTICKNQDCSSYEKYQYDSSSIYLVEDTSWATESGPVRCSDSGKPAFYRTYQNNSNKPMLWVKRDLDLNQCTAREGIIVSYELETGRECPAPYTGTTISKICATHQGCVSLPTGVWTNNGLILSITEGGGAGESYYFDASSGWIGFTWGGNTGNYSIKPINSGDPPESCLKISSQKYGACQADEPFKNASITKAESFAVKITSCFGSPQDPSKAINAVIKTISLEFPQNQKIATQLHTQTLKKLTPFNYYPAVQKKSALGKITYEVCEEGTSNWFNIEKEVEFKTPEWMKEMANSGEELAKMLVPSQNSNQTSFIQKNTTNNKYSLVLGEKDNSLAQSHSYSLNISPQITPLGGNNYSVCWLFQPQADCGLFDLSGNLSVSVGGRNVYASQWGPVRSISSPYRCDYAPFNGPISLTANPGENISVCVSVTNLNHHCGEDPRPYLSTCVSCEIGSNGEILNCGGLPIPTPTPRMCEGYSPRGETMTPEVVCVAGQCFLKDRTSNPAFGLLQSLLNAGLSLAEALQRIFLQYNFPLCQEKTYFVTPQIQTPYAWEADASIRNKTLSIFKISSDDNANQAFEFKHALQNSTQEIKASPATQYPSLAEIFGQAGVKNSYDWVQKALTPYSLGLHQENYTTLNYTVPFRNTNITVSQKAKQEVIQAVKANWPNSQIETQWDYVYNQAINNGWNPAFVIALWIEESGASGVNAYDLGCLGAPMNDLPAQLNCLFNRPYADQGFEEFMCQYSEGQSAPCVFQINPNFPKALKYWYDKLTQVG